MLPKTKPPKSHAVVLMNLGGPLSMEGVEDFLYNLFSDPAIIGIPNPFRHWLARFVARRRAVEASKIYAKLGGFSPLLENTQAQAQALQKALNKTSPTCRFEVFIAMRYAPPRAQDVVDTMAKTERPGGAHKKLPFDRIILVPLYPQFSTTTTGSSLKEFQELLAAKDELKDIDQKILCCYPTLPGFVAAQGDKIIQQLRVLPKVKGKLPRILYSAHGLPEKIVAKGDPYLSHVKATVEAVNAYLASQGYHADKDFSYIQCYQSKVGPVAWVKPATEDEIKRAGEEGVPLVVVPISFVSEHSETLVELDDEYKELAHEAKVPAYGRVPTVMADVIFVNGLAAAIQNLDASNDKVQTSAEASFCHGKSCHVCPLRQWEKARNV